jgi:hypothetical protein
MRHPDLEQSQASEIQRTASEEDVWEFIDQVMVDVLDHRLVGHHLKVGQGHSLTILDIHRQLPQEGAQYQQEFLAKHPVSIVQTVGTDVIPDRVKKSKRMEPDCSAQQFAYEQASLCVAGFITKDLIQYLKQGPGGTSRLADLGSSLDFDRDKLLNQNS